ncbi:hypothetical protein K7432_014372, partial [Basidiobolus ranarum]
MVLITKVGLALTVLFLSSPVLTQVQPQSPTTDGVAQPPIATGPPPSPQTNSPPSGGVIPESPVGGGGVSGTTQPASTGSPNPVAGGGQIAPPEGGVQGNNTISGDAKGNSTTTAMDPRDPPGRITMVNPSNPATVFPRFAIGDDIHFKWEFDKSLRVPPKELYLLAARISKNLEYPIAFNISGSSKEYVWKTGTWNQTLAPLTEDKDYILQIYDERGLKAIPEAGRLAIFRMPFGLYRRGGGDPFCTACLSSGDRLSPTVFTPFFA